MSRYWQLKAFWILWRDRKQIAADVVKAWKAYKTLYARFYQYEKHYPDLVHQWRDEVLPVVQSGDRNVKVTQGKYVNAKTTDDDVHMVITGYYIETIEPVAP